MLLSLAAIWAVISCFHSAFSSATDLPVNCGH